MRRRKPSLRLGPHNILLPLKHHGCKDNLYPSLGPISEVPSLPPSSPWAHIMIMNDPSAARMTTANDLGGLGGKRARAALKVPTGGKGNERHARPRLTPEALDCPSGRKATSFLLPALEVEEGPTHWCHSSLPRCFEGYFSTLLHSQARISRSGKRPRGTKCPYSKAAKNKWQALGREMPTWNHSSSAGGRVSIKLGSSCSLNN